MIEIASQNVESPLQTRGYDSESTFETDMCDDGEHFHPFFAAVAYDEDNYCICIAV